MINPIGNHSHRLHLGAAQGLSKVDKAAEDPPAAPPTPQDKLDAKETKKSSNPFQWRQRRALLKKLRKRCACWQTLNHPRCSALYLENRVLIPNPTTNWHPPASGRAEVNSPFSYLVRFASYCTAYQPHPIGGVLLISGANN